MDYIETSGSKPGHILYDDACHLSKYVTNKASEKFNNTTERGKIIASSIIACDRFHFCSHVDPWCKSHCDPDLYEGLKGVNTSVTEEINYWFGGFKHAFKHMNYDRYHFMLYIISDEFNKFRLVNYKYNQIRKERND